LVLRRALPHSGRWRGWLAEATDQAHLVEGLDAVARRLGGITRRWRFDRMSMVAAPKTGRMQVSFGPVALHYAVGVDLCPAYHAWRKGSVEKGAQVIAQRWWRTLSDERTHAQAQTSLNRLCMRLDGHKRKRDGVATTVGALAEAEPLRSAPAPSAAVVEVRRTVTNQALLAFRGNSYSVPPGHTAAAVLMRHRLGAATLDVVTTTGVTLARHRREPDGLGAIVRAEEHVAALEKVVLANFADQSPCRRKHRRPPTPAALAQAEHIRRARIGVVGEFAWVASLVDERCRGCRQFTHRNTLSECRSCRRALAVNHHGGCRLCTTTRRDAHLAGDPEWETEPGQRPGIQLFLGDGFAAPRGHTQRHPIPASRWSAPLANGAVQRLSRPGERRHRRAHLGILTRR
jgi:hypothetical protein